MQSTIKQGVVMNNNSGETGNKKSLIQRSSNSLGLLMFGVSQIVFAADAGQIAQNVSGSFNYIGLAVQAFAGLAGIVLIVISVFTFIKHNKTEGQGAKLSTAFLYLLLGGCLFYIASLIQTTGDTVWGTGGGDRSRVTISR